MDYSSRLACLTDCLVVSFSIYCIVFCVECVEEFRHRERVREGVCKVPIVEEKNEIVRVSICLIKILFLPQSNLTPLRRKQVKQ